MPRRPWASTLVSFTLSSKLWVASLRWLSEKVFVSRTPAPSPINVPSSSFFLTFNKRQTFLSTRNPPGIGTREVRTKKPVTPHLSEYPPQELAPATVLENILILSNHRLPRLHRACPSTALDEHRPENYSLDRYAITPRSAENCNSAGLVSSTDPRQELFRVSPRTRPGDPHLVEK
jgi:hypothetical protein